jgi:hypothetical protein
MNYFSNLFWKETLRVSDISFVHHQKFFTEHTAMVYVIQVCRQLTSRIRIATGLVLSQFHLDPGLALNQFYPVPARKLSANLYNIYHCCVYSEKLLMMDRGTVRNM